jgi:mRNA interferase MazF
VRPGAPSAGDLVWLNPSPPVGHEQTGRRPVLVISPLRYNRLVGLALCSPVTSKRKGYAFGVPIPPGRGVDGVVLADQLGSLDWAHRKPGPAGRVPDATLREVQARVTALLG